MKQFFSKKLTVFCLIAYLILTAFIYYTSFTNGVKSVLQSTSISNVISNVVELLSGNKVVLKDEGKDKTLYPETIDVQVNQNIFVGKIWKTTATLKPDGNYSLSNVIYSSSNESVFTVDEDGVITPIAPGVATLTVTDEFSKLSVSKQITVTSEVYIPKVTFTPMEETPYFSTANGVSGVYTIDYAYEVPQNKLSVDNNPLECDVTLGKDKIFFYPKKSGEITFNVIATFDNLNGKNQTQSYPFTVNVTEKTMPSFKKEFTISTTTVDMKTSNAGAISTNYSEFASGLDDTQKRIFFVTNNKHLNVYLDGDDIKFETTKVGTATVKLYYPTSSGLKSETVNVTIVQGVPREMKIVATAKYVPVGQSITVTVVGDGEVFSSRDFIWTANNGAIYSNGKYAATKRGHTTITAKHKTIEGFTVSLQIENKTSFKTYVRKVIGHFSLFCTLALFAFVVYYRLAEVIKPNKKLIWGFVLSLTAGLLTAGLSEFFQSEIFVAGRHPTFMDVVINFFGYLLTTVICVCLFKIRRKIKNKKGV